MTIRLLAQYQGNPPNTIVTLAGGVETALVAAGNASTDLSGGVPPAYTAPANSQIGDILYGPDGVPLGLADRTGKLLMNFNGITAPGAPTGLTLTPIAGGVLAAFTPSATLGGTVGTGFEVTLSNGQVQRGAASPIAINSPAGAVTATVKQINGAGLSVASAASASATVTAYTVPSPPAAPTIGTLVAGNGKVTVNWTAPAANGSALRGYLVTLSNGANEVAGPSATSIDVTTPNDVAVTARVRAMNGEGQGPRSAESNSVTPTSVVAPPSAPVIVAVTGFNNRVMVNMVAPAAGTVSQYKLTSSNGQTVTVSANGLPYQAVTITGQPNGTPVTIQAQAIAAGGATSAMSTASASVTPVASRQISAAGNTFIPDAKHSANKQSMNVNFFVAARDLTTLGVEFPGWYVTGRRETNNTGTETWEADVTWNGNVKRITFSGGANSGTVAPGADLKSDETALGFTIPAGDEFSVGNFCTTTGEITFFSWYAADGKARASYGVSGVSNLVGVLDKSALPVVTSTPSTGAFVRGPSAIFSTGDGPAVALSIDSNSVGRGDTGDDTHSQGHLGRALRAANIPYMHVGVSGDWLFGTASDGWLSSSPKRIGLAKRYSTHGMSEPPVNDLTGGRTAVQAIANRLTFKNLWGATFPMAFTTLPPVTSGDFTTVGGQVPSTASAEIQAFNTSTLDGVAGAIAIFDVNLMTCAPGDRTRWNVGPGAVSYTVEGTHFNQAGALFVAPQIAAQMSMLVG